MKNEYVLNAKVLNLYTRKRYTDYDCEQLYKTFKYFRDLCTKNHSLQNDLCKELLQSTVSIVNNLFRYYEDKFLPPLKQGLQFIYNLTVGNCSNDIYIYWACRDHFPKWMCLENEKVRNYISGILYNITRAHEEIGMVIINNVSLICCIINSAMRGTDFSLMFFERMWVLLETDEVEMLLDSLCEYDTSVVIAILNMVYEYIKEFDDVFVSRFHEWVIKKYKTFEIVNEKHHWSLGDIQMVYILLKIIVLLSSKDTYNKVFQQDIQLLTITKSFLETIHIEGKNPDSVFAPTENIFTERTSVENLKTNLIRLIGNLCWRNKTTQDRIRECNGLPLILDCCIRDGKNPFITEVVIFAIRNLCEGNIENQNFIKDMNQETHNKMSERTQNWPSVFVPG